MQEWTMTKTILMVPPNLRSPSLPPTETYNERFFRLGAKIDPSMYELPTKVIEADYSATLIKYSNSMLIPYLGVKYSVGYKD